MFHHQSQMLNKQHIFANIIGPQYDHHWLPLSLTPSLTNSCLVDLIDMTLTCGEDYSKLVEVVTVSHVGDEKRVDNSLVQFGR